jgi:hypothetical protein
MRMSSASTTEMSRPESPRIGRSSKSLALFFEANDGRRSSLRGDERRTSVGPCAMGRASRDAARCARCRVCTWYEILSHSDPGETLDELSRLEATSYDSFYRATEG